MKTTTNRSAYWDIVKGFGIIAIVLGHCGIFAGGFVYLFHMALFFFVTGYFYREEQYGDEPFRYFGTRLSGCWPRYFFYAACFVFLHNFFAANGLYANAEIYNHTAMLTYILHGISFSCPEPIQGALWFVPVWLVSSALFAGIVWFGRAASRRLGRENLKPWITAFGVLSFGACGLFLYARRCTLPYQLHAAILVIPFYYAAWMMRKHLPGFRRYATWYGCLIGAVLLWQINASLHIYVDISNLTIPGILYYPIALLGIYFVLSLSAVTEKAAPAAKGLAFIGRHSFDIMALHFTVFKLIDLAYARLIGGAAPEQLAGFPVGFRAEIGPVYLLLGVLVPALAGWGLDRAARFLLPKSR